MNHSFPDDIDTDDANVTAIRRPYPAQMQSVFDFLMKECLKKFSRTPPISTGKLFNTTFLLHFIITGLNA